MNDARAEKVSDFKLESMQLTKAEQQLVYLPLYVSNYVYRQTEYKFIVSGQKGTLRGQRPYGLGKLGALGGSIASMVFGKKK